MGIIKAFKLGFDYLKYDEDGNVQDTQRAVNDVNLDIEAGDFVAVLGHNGSGKSTLAKQINALLIPSEGTMWVDDMDTAKEPELWKIRQKAGMVFQNPDNQIIGTVVEEDVGFGPENMGVPTDEIWKRVDDSLKKTGMTAYRYQSPNKLSGGQKQRVAMARMLAAQPEVILLDEPFSALDSYLKWELEQEMKKILQEVGKPALFVSHNRDEVYRLCDMVSCINQGKMEVIEEVHEFFQNPKTRTAAILSGCKNISDVEIVDAHTLFAKDWNVTFHCSKIPEHTVAIGIRAHYFEDAKEKDMQNTIEVKEYEIIEDPFEWNVSFRADESSAWIQWKIAKKEWNAKEQKIPEALGVQEKDILFLQ